MSDQLWLLKTNELDRPAPSVRGYDCPGCGRRVVDMYVEGDALCCWCRDISDPRLSPRIVAIRNERAQ